MAWTKSTTTKHTCGGPVFGRKTAGCPRCEELLAGAAPVVWGQRTADHSIMAELRAHDCKASRCGPVCTFGDW
jgi:hypothetical protein